MAKEKTKLKEPEQPRKPKAVRAPKKPKEIIRKDFEISIPQCCYFGEDEYDQTYDELKDCFVCSNSLQEICNSKKISFADLLKIRSKIGAADEDIYMYADHKDYDNKIIIYWDQDTENPNYQAEMQKYHKDIEKLNLKLKEHEAKLKEYENKLEEYKILKAEFIKQKAEQDLNHLLK